VPLINVAYAWQHNYSLWRHGHNTTPFADHVQTQWIEGNRQLLWINLKTHKVFPYKNHLKGCYSWSTESLTHIRTSTHWSISRESDSQEDHQDTTQHWRCCNTTVKETQRDQLQTRSTSGIIEHRSDRHLTLSSRIFPFVTFGINYHDCYLHWHVFFLDIFIIEIYSS
jgi:hypothetical protein